jgi:hypothetical protein
MSHREIIALADKYLAEHQAELVNEATEIVDRFGMLRLA